ncbi:MAG: hypothetical protein ACL93V_12235 [Candidatus Electrothrix sp. YB6]
MVEIINNIAGILPPIFVSISGLIPLMFKASPINVNKQLLPLTSVIYVISIWVIYLLILMTGDAYTFYSPKLTIFTLISGLSFFVLLMIMLSLKKEYSSLVTGGIFFTASILTLTGFTNHLASNGKTVFFFENDQISCKDFTVRWKGGNNHQSHKLPLKKGLWGSGAVWIEKELDMTNLSLRCKNEEPKPFKFQKMEYVTWGTGNAYLYKK